MYLNEPIYNSVSDMSMLELAKYLYPLPRSLTGRGIDHSFMIFESIHTSYSFILSFWAICLTGPFICLNVRSAYTKMNLLDL